MSDPRRMRLLGLHHVTAICADLDRTTAFDRDLLGLALVREGVNDDDPSARHFWFGDAEGSRGRSSPSWSTRGWRTPGAGRGATHHFAFAVASDQELTASADYLRSRDVPSPTSSTAGGCAPSMSVTRMADIVEVAVGRPA